MFLDTWESFWTLSKVSGYAGKFLDFGKFMNTLESFWTLWKSLRTLWKTFRTLWKVYGHYEMFPEPLDSFCASKSAIWKVFAFSVSGAQPALVRGLLWCTACSGAWPALVCWLL